VKASYNFILNEWTYVAFIVKDTSASIYINGNLIASGYNQKPLSSITRTNNYIGSITRTNNYIGSSMSMLNAYAIFDNKEVQANAIFDDIKIFKGAMNALQIKNNYIYNSQGKSNQYFFHIFLI
jgi:hypothetical protein